MMTDRLTTARRIFRETLQEGGSGREAAFAFTRAVEQLITDTVKEVYPESLLQENALFAHGALARRTMMPYADADLILAAKDDRLNAELEPLNRQFIRRLWDEEICVKLHLVTMQDMARDIEKDMNFATSALEAHSIFPTPNNAPSVLSDALQKIDVTTWQRMLSTELQERETAQGQMGTTVLLAKPHLLSSPGALRDYDRLVWLSYVSAACFKEFARTTDSELQWLIDRDLLTAGERAQLENAHDVLLCIRAGLHFVRSRKEDRLCLSDQSDVALALQASSALDVDKAPVMNRYYRAALSLRSIADIVTDRVREHHEGRDVQVRPPVNRRDAIHQQTRIRALEFGLREKNGWLYTDDTISFDASPQQGIDIFRVAHERSLRLSPQTRTRFFDAMAPIAESQLENNLPCFQSILRLARSMSVQGTPFTDLLENGLLPLVLSDLRRLRFHLKSDGYHAYTTDAHLCHAADMALQVAAGVIQPPDALKPALARTSRFHLLVLASLFHDIGKGAEGDHSEVGAAIARREAEKMGLPKGEVSILEFLVQNHLLLLKVSQQRDIHDPNLILDLSRSIRTVERLDLLVLLTWIDLSSVAPGMCSDWKIRLLAMTAERVDACLKNPDAEHQIMQDIEREARQEAQRVLSHIQDNQSVARFIDGSSCRSLASRNDEDTKEDYHAFEHYLSSSPEPYVESKIAKGGFSHHLRVVCENQGGLLGNLTDALSQSRVNVLHAHIDTRSDGIGFYAFVIDNGDGDGLDGNHLEATIQMVREAATGRSRLPESHEQSAPSAYVHTTPRVRLIEGGDSWGATILDVRSDDRPGLLAELTRAIFDHGWNVVMAKINTDGMRARDVFFLMPQKDVGSQLRSAQALQNGIEKCLSREPISSNENEAPREA